MFYHDKRLQFPVRVDSPDPIFAKMLQQALGGSDGEIRVVLQYLFQASNNRGPAKYRDMLLETCTEDMGHAEMLATAIALNLEGSPAATQEAAARDNPMVAAVMGGMSPRAYLSGGMGALCADSEGNPFDGSWVMSSGNIAADMFANATGEATNACVLGRLSAMTDDPGMKRMLGYLMSRDVMHQQQWLAVIEELGGYRNALPIPNSFDHGQELTQYSRTFFSTAVDGIEPPQGRWTSGPSLDGKGEYRTERLRAMGEEPRLAPPIPQAFAQREQMEDGRQRVGNADTGGAADDTGSDGVLSRSASGVRHVVEDLTGSRGHGGP